MSSKRRRISKKELERLKQEVANRRSKARSESERRKARIGELWREVMSGRLVPKDKESATELAESELVRSLVELVGEQKREIEYLTQFRQLVEQIRRRFSNDFANLRSANEVREFLEFASVLSRSMPKLTAKQQHEHKRRRYGDGEIEQQFGGVPSLVPSLGALRGLSDCLDDIFKGDAVNMMRLEKLFGMDRNRFPKLPVIRRGREWLYDYRAVVAIMKKLLSETPPKRKASARGRPRRLWLSDPALRMRVISGIEARINSFSPGQGIKDEFLAVVHHHLPDSAKK